MDFENTWLIACERSGRIRDAMLRRGIRAISCDLKSTRVDGPHLQCDVRDILHFPWGGMIAHPDCTFLTNAGVRWLTRKGRYDLMYEGADFYKQLCDAEHIPLRAIENPIMHKWAFDLIGHRATQFVQPWMFGSPKTKATGFRLYGLPKLPQEKRLEDYHPDVIIRPEVWLMGPSDDRQELRSRTDLEIARAVAQYWGPLINKGAI